VLVDSGIISSIVLRILLTTPNIYIVVALFVIPLLYLSILLDRRKVIAYHKLMFLLGLVLCSIAISFIHFVNLYGAVLIFLFTFPWLLFSFFFKRWSFENKFALFFQMLDANVTFVTLNFFSSFYKEQHVVPNFLINLFGLHSFIIAKLVAVVAILILIDKLSKNKELNKYIKLIIGVLGAATGIRDALRLVALV
jgi:uncharacterized membrane protein